MRAAQIHLDHSRGRESIHAGDWVEVRDVSVVEAAEPVSCAIPGLDRPGVEVRTELRRVNDGPLHCEVRGRCGFATDFVYSSD